MSIGKLWTSASTFIPECITSTASWGKGIYSSVSENARYVTQRVHHVARKILLTSIGWFLNEEIKTDLMRDVEDFGKKSYEFFGSKYKASFELYSMISALSARLLICAEKKQPKATGFIAHTHRFLLFSLTWLEGEESSSLLERVTNISKKMEDVRKLQTDEYSSLFNSIISIQAKVEVDKGSL
jgi:hypothetical protein